MKKIIPLIKGIALSLASLASLIASIILYINSYSYWYDQEYGYTDISFEENYLIGIIVSLIVLAYGIYALVTALKKKEENVQAMNIAGITSSALLSFYGLGVFFKALMKAISKGKQFNFASNQTHLFVGIGALLVLCAFTFLAIRTYKANKQK